MIETEVEFASGYRLDKGMISANFALGETGKKVEMQNPLVLLVDEEISNMADIAKFLDYAAGKKRPLLIVARGIKQEVLTYLLVNKAAGKCDICAVGAKTDLLAATGSMEDIEALTNSRPIGRDCGLPLREADAGCLGSARKVIVHLNHTVIVRQTNSSTDGSLQFLRSRIKRKIEEASREEGSEELVQIYRQRLSRLMGKSATIHVGGATEAEVSETKDRLDDSIRAAQAAIEEGVIVGGGAALIHASKMLPAIKAGLNAEERVGVELVEKACRLPCRIIAENAGAEGTLDSLQHERRIEDCGAGVSKCQS